MSPIPRDISPQLGLVDTELASLPRLQLAEPSWPGRQRLTVLALEPGGGTIA
jgi:hypothetical protein